MIEHNEAANELIMFLAILVALPYVVGIPLAIIWVGIAQVVRALTGWRVWGEDDDGGSP